MYCPNCKNKILENAAVCHFCGADLSKIRAKRVKLGDEPEEDENRFDDRMLNRKEFRDALSYDPFKEKIRFHMIGAMLMLLAGVGMLLILFFTIGIFGGTTSMIFSVLAGILTIGGLIYGVILIFMFMR